MPDRQTIADVGKCLICVRVSAVFREGADHHGIDVYLRCRRCGNRTISHIECHRVTPLIIRQLRGEWRRGATILEALPE